MSIGEIDLFVGQKLRQIRVMRNMSQASLAKEIDLTFQQIQKYEGGVNRVSSSTLYSIAKILDVPISYFFDGIDGRASINDNMRYMNENQSSAEERVLVHNPDRLLENKEVMQLLRSFASITDLEVKRKVIALVKSLTSSADISA